jgi:outer membrane protein assembly factor BamB/signal recognition particle receptor subunit beta
MSESTRTSALSVDIDALVEYLNTASIRLAVFGEFSAGKTTVLNALIGEEILSVAVEPTTAVPTRVRYGREFNIFVERTGGDGPALFEDDPPFWTRFVGRRDTLSTLQKQQDTIRDFLRTWTKEGERADEVERVVIELPLDWLKGGLELVDTPGVNNEFARHRGFTEQEAGAADLAVLLMDARQGGGKRTEFEFMNEVEAQVERCVVAPNKLDLVPEGEREEFLGYIRETALPKHWDGAVTPPVVGISALAALRPGDHDEPDLVDAFADLRDRLERVAEEERGSLLLARKGNPEKRLFTRAKELEGNGHYGRAHRLYFDLLDVLEAAGLDPTPAEEGIARCEEHLSAQVDTLDALNERYNEAMALAEEDPDAALEELTAIRDEKEDLRLKDGDLHASIEELQSRIEKRDTARSRIRVTKTQVEQHRDNENWIEAAEAAQKIPSLIETAELSAERTETLRQFVATQMQDRDEWAENRWMSVKDDADACVEDQRFLDAEEYLDELETVAPYTPFEAETAEFAAEVREKAKAEEAYREAVRTAMDEAEVLREDRVDPDAGAAVEETIEKAADRYRAVYGAPDLSDRPPIDASDLPLTIDQKLGLARYLHTVANHTPTHDEATALVEALETRKAEIEMLSGKDKNDPALVQEYPDHPASATMLRRILGEKVHVWTPPWRIEAKRDSLLLINGDGTANEQEIESLGGYLRKKSAQAKAFYCVFISLLVAFCVSIVGMYFLEWNKYKSIGEINEDEKLETMRELHSTSWFFRGEVESRIDSILDQGKTYLREGDLKSPKGKKAYENAKRVLHVDSNNAEAERIINDIITKTVKNETGRVSERGKYDVAKKMIKMKVGNKRAKQVIKEANKSMLNKSRVSMLWGGVSRAGKEAGPAPLLNVLPISEEWHFSVSNEFGLSNFNDQPAISLGNVYFSGDKIYSLDINTGSVEWSFGSSYASYSSPVVTDSIVYVSSSVIGGPRKSKLHVLDAKYGTYLWSHKFNSKSLSSPLKVNEFIYVGDGKGNIHALSTKNRSKVWTVETKKSSIISTPAFGHGKVFVSSGNGYTYAIDAEKGSIEWATKTDNNVESTPVFDKGYVYLAGGNNGTSFVSSLDSGSGRTEWRFTSKRLFFSKPTVAYGNIYTSRYDGKVYALDSSSGEEKWTFDTSYGPVVPVISDSTLFAGNITAIDPFTGNKIWRMDLTKNNLRENKSRSKSASISLLGGRIFLDTRNNLHVFGNSL